MCVYTTGKKIYTAGGSDGSEKSHLCLYPEMISQIENTTLFDRS